MRVESLTISLNQHEVEILRDLLDSFTGCDPRVYSEHFKIMDEFAEQLLSILPETKEPSWEPDDELYSDDISS